MYLAFVVENDCVTNMKAFRNFDLATYYADVLVMNQIGYGSDIPNWDENANNVFTAPNGVSVMIQQCDEPEQIDSRFRSSEYGVNIN